MENPWEKIELSDYENHMRLMSVMQLQTMNKMMKQQFYSYPIKNIMILGIAGGNGLEHIDAKKFNKIYGIDINKDYIEKCCERYSYLRDVLELLCIDLTKDISGLPNADLIIANLLIEYIGYEYFSKTVQKVRPNYISCIIQVNTDSSFVSDSPYLHVFDELEFVHCDIDENGLTEVMESIGYSNILKSEEFLPNGKKLLRLDYSIMIN